MQLLVIARPAGAPSLERLVQAAVRLGVSVTVVDPLESLALLEGEDPELRTAGGEVLHADAVLPRAGSTFPDEVATLTRHCALAGIRPLLDADALLTACDQWATLQALASAGIPFPPSRCFRSATAIPETLEALGLPVVVKTRRGSKGDGVVLAEDALALETLLDTYLGMGEPVLVQRYVKESAGQDIRALVLGDRVVACMRRIAPEGSFRANLDKGARGEAVDPVPPVIEQRAVAAARAVGLPLCGVDLVESDDGPQVLEVNATPGLARISDITGVDVAAAVMEWILRTGSPGMDGLSTLGA
ncbi:MAG: ATP-grasp domain-containing protein [Planctomycetota bacterium]|jgi:ribosomal protein S6--L-glutamate ligase